MPLSTLTHIIDWTAVKQLQPADFRAAVQSCVLTHEAQLAGTIIHGYRKSSEFGFVQTTQPTLRSMKRGIERWLENFFSRGAPSIGPCKNQRDRIKDVVYRLGKGTAGFAEALLYEMVIGEVIRIVPTDDNRDAVEIDLSKVDAWVEVMLLRKDAEENTNPGL